MSANSRGRLSPLERLQNGLRVRRTQSCAVYGSGADAAALLHSLGKDGVRGDRFYNTRYHAVLMGDDGETLQFYRNHRQRMQSGHVVLALEGEAEPAALSGGDRAVSMADVTATLFWRVHPAKPDESLAFIGGDALPAALLRQGLCLNLYAPSQHIQYHLWDTGGDAAAMAALHTVITDPVIAHTRPWRADISLLLRMDRIVLCGAPEENRAALTTLRAQPGCPPIFIRYGLPPGDGEAPTGVFPFGGREETLSREIVLKESLLQDAKRLNDYYRSRYGGEPWETLSPLHRASGISSAGYFPVLRRLSKVGVPPETLAELEHIRWCRFHLLRGWRYGPVRDDGRLIHNCLIPYARLTEEEKQKDRDNVALALCPPF